MGTSEESGKDWSELEEEAAAADKHREDFVDDYTKKKSGAKDYKGKKSSSSDHRHKGSSSSSMKNGTLKRSRDDRDGKHKKMKK